MSQAVSGLAASIRGATESETFDLAGHSQDNINVTITSAFEEPLPLEEMIRITFVTGAGKLGRQKYDDGAAKALTSALRSLGYEEDRAASCVVECGGTFKMQHDTGKNLKTVVVFPKIAVHGVEDGSGVDSAVRDTTLVNAESLSSLIKEGSPEHMIAVSSKGVFQRMLQSKCSSWSQKKGCVTALGSVKKVIEELETKLLSGTPLTDAEQELYDSISVSSLGEKEAFVKKEMQIQVESGNITGMEKSNLLSQVSEKMDNLNHQIAEAEKENKAKKAERLIAMKSKVVARKQMLEKIEPKAPHGLRHEAEIAKLRAEMRPLKKIEYDARGRLLSLKEASSVARKDEIVEQIRELEEASRDWFEEDGAFLARVEASRAAANAQEKGKKLSSKTGGRLGANSGYKTKPVTNWVTPGAGKKKPSSKVGTKSKGGGGGIFAAMMDSDSE